MAQRLIISSEAFDDIDRIIEFNNNRNKSTNYSSTFLKGLKQLFYSLELNPKIGLKTSEEDIYILIWNNFYIYYKFIDTELPLIIINIFHQKENINF